jgi:ATP-binding cassette subfamily F protein 3
MVVFQKPNLLLLDEPTNHLDLDMRHALETALMDYAGAVVLVSHDRHLLSSTCDALWLVADGRCQEFEGDLGDYARWLGSRDTTKESTPKSGGRTSAKDERRAAADQRVLIRTQKDAIKKLDTQMARMQKDLAALDARLADPVMYEASRSAEVAKLLREQGELKKKLAAMEEEWLAASEQLAALDA